MVKVVRNHGQGNPESWPRYWGIMVKIVRNHGQESKQSWPRQSGIMARSWVKNLWNLAAIFHNFLSCPWSWSRTSARFFCWVSFGSHTIDQGTRQNDFLIRLVSQISSLLQQFYVNSVLILYKPLFNKDFWYWIRERGLLLNIQSPYIPWQQPMRSPFTGKQWNCILEPF